VPSCLRQSQRAGAHHRGGGVPGQSFGIIGEDGYFLKYKADLLWMKGKREDALLLYAEAREKTNNGIVQLELDKLLQKEKTPFYEIWTGLNCSRT